MEGHSVTKGVYKYYPKLESGQFQRMGIIGKNAYVIVIYLSVLIDYIPFGVGYCLLLILGQSRASTW